MTKKNISKEKLKRVLSAALKKARKNTDGKVANYIPELATIAPDKTHVAVHLCDGTVISTGDMEKDYVSLQSTAKLVVLIGLLEEFGAEKVFEWVRVEPSGDDFASIARLDQFGPVPSNPMLNAGAIALCSHIPGEFEDQLRWTTQWVEKLFNQQLRLNQTMFASERRTGNRNRALAYLLKSTNNLKGSVKNVLEVYFMLCSYEATVEEAAYLPMLLANQGKNPKGDRVISSTTAKYVLAIMATCGLYNESGTHLVHTGIPAKSGVSGLILGAAVRHAGIAVASPRVNPKGTSIRGEIILHHLSEALEWHFAD